MELIKSPCIDVCDLKSGYCIGCKRSEFEITNWLNFSDKERENIMYEIDSRIVTEK